MTDNPVPLKNSDKFSRIAPNKRVEIRRIKSKGVTK